MALAFFAAGLGSVAFLGSCDRQVVLTQTVSFDNEEGGPRGFTCTDTRGRPLFANVGTSFSVVTDFLAIGGNPSCRGVAMRAWCSAHDCTVLADRRQCFPVNVDPANRDAGSLEDQVLGVLRGQVVSSDAPDEYVLVRVVATKTPCASLALAFDCPSLLGCAVSCPYYPLGPAGDISIDLDYTTPPTCEPAMYACASLTGSDPTFCEPDAGTD